MAVGLLRHANRTGTVVAGDTIGIRGAGFQAVGGIAGTLVRRATLGPGVKADPGPVAQVRQIERRTGAHLVGTRGPGIPVLACPGPVALAIITTTPRGHGCTVGFRVSILSGVLTGTTTGANSARTALIFGVGIIAVVGAGTFLAAHIAGLAGAAAGTVAAETVHAVPAGTLEVEAAGFARGFLLNTFAIGAAVVPEGAVELLGTSGAAIFTGVRTGVAVARLVTTVGANASAIAGIGKEEHAANAVLREADRAIVPVGTVAGTVAEPIEPARGGGHGRAVVDRVGVVIRGNTLIINTGADPARRTVVFRVRVGGVQGAGPFLALQGTGFAPELARAVAAVTVSAEAAVALVVRTALFALCLLAHAGARETVRIGAALVVGRTSGPTGCPTGIAGVGTARVVPSIRTGPGTVAQVGVAHGIALANLLDTDGGGGPVVAGPGPVAGPVETAALLQGLGALVLHVSPLEGRLAATRTVTDPTQPTFKLGVEVGGMVGTSPLGAGHSTGATIPSAPFVAAVAVNTVAAGALITIGADRAIVLLGHARRTMAVVANAAVGVGRTAIAASIRAQAAGVGTAALGARLKTGPNTVAIIGE